MPYEYGFPKYVSVAEKRARAERSLANLRKRNPDIAPVVVIGRKLTNTWWGKAWNDNLERYSDYAYRIGRGKSYVRHGAVLDLQIAPGTVSALVQGSEDKPYRIQITIQPLSNNTWEKTKRSCEGAIESLQELLNGQFPKSLSDLFTAQGTGLFPMPKEIALQCSCPDWASMCKHVAAALYGVGTRLDENPALFFVLRNVNIDDLISKTITQKSETLLKKSSHKSDRVMDSDDISAMFGIDLEEDNETATAEDATRKPIRPRSKKKP